MTGRRRAVLARRSWRVAVLLRGRRRVVVCWRRRAVLAGGRLAIRGLVTTVLRWVLPWRRALRGRIVSLRRRTGRRLVVAALLLRRRVLASRRRVVSLLRRRVMAMLRRRVLALGRGILLLAVALRWRRLCDKSVGNARNKTWKCRSRLRGRLTAVRRLAVALVRHV